MIGINPSSMISIPLKRISNAKRETNLSSPLIGQELTTTACMMVTTLKVLVHLTIWHMFVNPAVMTKDVMIANANEPKLSTYQAFQWFSLMSSKERDFVAKPFLTMKAKLSMPSTQTRDAELATRTVD